MNTILCVGRAVWDQLFYVDSLPLMSGKVPATKHREAGGGPAATAAGAIAQLGGNSVLWSRIGDDKTGKNIVKELYKYGVDISEICIIPKAKSPVAAVLVDNSGERGIAAYIDSNLYQSTTSLSETLPANTKMVLADVRWPEGGYYSFKLAQKLSIPTLLDIEKTDHPKLEELISLATYAVFSQSGLISFTQEKDITSALHKAACICRGTVCVTLGDKGCMWLEGTTIRTQQSFKVETIDTTGAGDVFHGALALSLSRNSTFEEAARFASAAAALKCTMPGGREGIPDEQKLLNFLAGN